MVRWGPGGGATSLKARWWLGLAMQYIKFMCQQIYIYIYIYGKNKCKINIEQEITLLAYI
jgi:hypothetical protein